MLGANRSKYYQLRFGHPRVWGSLCSDDWWQCSIVCFVLLGWRLALHFDQDLDNCGNLMHELLIDHKKLAWAAIAIAITAAWLLGPDMRIMGTTVVCVAVSWAVLSRLEGKRFVLACVLMSCGVALVFGDAMRSLRSLGWISYTILLMLLVCALSVRVRRMLLATDSMRTALAGYWIRQRSGK